MSRGLNRTRSRGIESWTWSWTSPGTPWVLVSRAGSSDRAGAPQRCPWASGVPGIEGRAGGGGRARPRDTAVASASRLVVVGCDGVAVPASPRSTGRRCMSQRVDTTNEGTRSGGLSVATLHSPAPASPQTAPSQPTNPSCGAIESPNPARSRGPATLTVSMPRTTWAELYAEQHEASRGRAHRDRVHVHASSVVLPGRYPQMVAPSTTRQFSLRSSSWCARSALAGSSWRPVAARTARVCAVSFIVPGMGSPSASR